MQYSLYATYLFIQHLAWFSENNYMLMFIIVPSVLNNLSKQLAFNTQLLTNIVFILLLYFNFFISHESPNKIKCYYTHYYVFLFYSVFCLMI